MNPKPMDLSIITTPFGPLTVVVTAAGAVHAAGFTTDPRTLVPDPPAATRPDLSDITVAVKDYLAGDLGALDRVPVDPPPTGEFLHLVQRTLRRVPPGSPITYTALAALAGRPAAVRAAAAGCARNQVALFVPCHRIIRTDGGLGGYRWGLPVKEALLRHERRAQSDAGGTGSRAPASPGARSGTGSE